MMNEIRKAVMTALREKFQLPVYGQKVPQGGRRPCFTVELQEMKQERLLGQRAARKTVFMIRYFSGEGEQPVAERLTEAEGVWEALLIIGKDEKFAASGMEQEKTDDGMKFRVEYEYHVIFTEDKAELMQRLTYNGKEAVGYEEEKDIQQRTAE